jgi:tetratricopeptide (TPR) repeat protein
MAASGPSEDPVSRLAAALRELQQAAGTPPPSELKRQGQAQVPPIVLPSSTVSDWLRGKSAPSESRAFLFLVDYLRRRAQRTGSTYVPPTTAQWQILLERAQGHRRSNQGGRPTRDHEDTEIGPSGSRVTVTSAYLEQVRRIAPPDLVAREAELAELARFCLDPGQDAYAWWQAEAWAGKSALLSSFVLRPPAEVAEHVRLTSFFITARLAAQDTREAFTQVMLEQLAGLLGEPLPPVLPEATREAFLLDLLSRAAAACKQAGRRLVLVVDGLDEDRGVTAGPGAHSIAGLLPADPPHGMRVIVAGRPNPPVPGDVPDWHPLRDLKIIRPLRPSRYAGDLQRLSNQELRHLLRGSLAERDVLGLLTAARGGLSDRDLEELTGVPRWDIEEILHTAAGRTFTRRASQRTSGLGADTYLLGHEELQAAAEGYLGGRRLADYRDRLHVWAATWRVLGWPSNTPEYLLGGYYRLLDQNGDLPRMTELAGDLTRHNRMMRVTGGDTIALAEVHRALDRIAAQDAPELGQALALAYHRDQLSNRNSHIPAELPPIWATLGRPLRAEALARSIGHPAVRAKALAGVAAALAAAGQHEHAIAVAEQAEEAARSLTFPFSSIQENILASTSRVLTAPGQHGHAPAKAKSHRGHADRQAKTAAEIAAALAAAGQQEYAAALARQVQGTARAVDSRHLQSSALAAVATALAAAGLYEHAVTVVHAVTERERQAGALADITASLAAAGQRKQATKLARLAEATVQSIGRRAPSPHELDQKAKLLADIAEALAAAGQHESAAAILRHAEAVAQSMSWSHSRDETLADVAGALAAAGQHQRARTIAQSITRGECQAKAWGRIAKALAVAGQPDQAAIAAGQAEAAARSITSTEDTALDDKEMDLLIDAARALVAAGLPDHAAAIAGHAEALAGSIGISTWRATSLTSVAIVLATAGRLEHATRVARSIADPDRQVQALVDIVEVLAEAGQREHAIAVAGEAEALARSIVDPDRQVRPLADLVEVLAEVGQREHAVAVAGEAEALARSTIDSDEQKDRAWASAARALAVAGQHERGVEAAQSVSAKHWKAQAMADVAEALAAAGQHEYAAAIAGQAEALARESTWGYGQMEEAMVVVARSLAATGDCEHAAALAEEAEATARKHANLHWSPSEAQAGAAEVLAAAGRHERAIEIAESITGDSKQKALTGIAKALAAAGRHERALEIVQSISGQDWKAQAMADIAKSLAAAGQHEHSTALARQAEALARSATDSSMQAQALAGVAEALAATGDFRTGNQAAAIACTIGEWTTPLKAVLSLMPSAITPLMQALQTGPGSARSTRSGAGERGPRPE